MQYFLKLIIFLSTALIFSGCLLVGLPAPPQTSRCIVDFKKQIMYCQNTKNTRFKIKLSSSAIDKMICMPGEDFIKNAAYTKKVLNHFMQVLDVEKAKR